MFNGNDLGSLPGMGWLIAFCGIGIIATAACILGGAAWLLCHVRFV